MQAQLQNAAPYVNLEGIQDSSPATPQIVAEQLPSHLPKFYLYTQKGDPSKDELVIGDSANQIFGQLSFDLRSKYASHATVGAAAAMANANQIVVRRLKPADAPKPAAVRLSLDVLGPVAVPVYLRNSDGSYQLDDNNQPKQDGSKTVQGYKVKFVLDPIGVDSEGNDLFGQGTQTAGDQTDAATSTQSKKYPIWDIDASSFGEWGNNNAVRFYAPTQVSPIPLDSRILTDEKVYPFRMAFASRPDSASSTAVIPTTSGDQYVDVCFVPGVIDKNTDAQLYVGANVPSAWQTINNPSFPNSYGPFGRFHSYDAEIATLVEAFYSAEQPFIDGFSDFTGAADEQNLFNFVGGVSSQNVPYHSYVFNTTDANAVRLTENTNIFALDGGDGTMTAASFDSDVGNAIQEYADPNNVIQDTAAHPESIFYDTGYTLATKKKLASFIAVRKDTFLVLATHDVSGPQLSASQESSVALSLKTMVSLYPESEVYGTPVVRAMIVGRSGTFVGSQWTKPLPLSIEVLIKSCQYMGAGNGKWKGTKNFDRAPGSVVQYFSGINVTFTPYTQRAKDWATGLVWVQSYSRKAYFFPALKTVYNDDTSVLNSYFTALICCELEKVAERSWREFSGESSLTDAQLCAAVDDFISAAVLGRFDGRVVIEPKTTVTGRDAVNGFSWTTVINVYANNMKTIGTVTINTLRMSQLQQNLNTQTTA